MKIVITGASSGLGAALARAYAEAGAQLYLIARNSDRLASVADICTRLGAKVETRRLDVTDRNGMAVYLSSLGPVDLVIANAGISAGTGERGESAEQAQQIFAANVDGVLNTIHPFIPALKQAGQGQIAIISSLAGLRGLPTAPAYSASKGAVRLYGEGLRCDLAPFGVGVTVICPGFIRTPMTDVNNFTMPQLMEVDDAAALIKRRLKGNPARIAFPLALYLLVRVLAMLPVSWADLLLSRLPKKPAVAKP